MDILESMLDSLSHGEGAPASGPLLWSCYERTKQYLETEYYDWVQAACPYYTDHGRHHIDSVIASASQLCAHRIGEAQPLFNIAEVYLLLTSIIWHDVGMTSQRASHPEMVGKLTTDIMGIAFPNTHLRAIVADVVRAHSGPTGLAKPDQDDTVTVGSDFFRVKPRTIAALLRFADEISENHNRVSSAVLGSGVVPTKNLIYWEYAKSVASSIAEKDRDRVVVTFHLQHDKVLRRFECKDYSDRCDEAGTMSLLEYVLCRIEKMNNERLYCASHFRHLIDLRKLSIRLTVMRVPLT